jgi:putative membrane protein insertion efficiency factor
MAWTAGAPVRAVLIGAISAYRLLLGGMLAGRCRFHPSCSAYALDAIRIHGALRGSALAVWRVLRCSPLTAGGVDPVPARPERGPAPEAVR